MTQPVPQLTEDTSIDERLIYLLCDKDKNGISLIFEHYGPFLLNVIKKVIYDDDMAEDVLMNVLLKVWQKFDQFDAEKGSLFSWLVRITKNSSIDKTRTKDFRLTEESRQGPELLNIAEEVSIDDSIDKMYIKQLLDQLPQMHRKLIDMSYFEGFTHKEIAQRLDLPLGTVKTRIRLAIKHLRSIV